MKIYLVVILLFTASSAFSQELFTNVKSGDICLFLGNLSMDGQRAKVLDHGEIRWVERKHLEQIGLFSTTDFINEVFRNNLQFEMGGYEPFWEAHLANNLLMFTDSETGKETAYPVRMVTTGNPAENHIFFMFGDKQGNVFGLVDYVGLADPAEQQYCEYNLVEDEALMYSVFITVGNRAYKGCATIKTTKNSK